MSRGNDLIPALVAAMTASPACSKIRARFEHPWCRPAAGAEARDGG
jgi:hypothetical protein